MNKTINENEKAIKYLILIFAMIGFFIGTIITGCNDPYEKKVQDARENLNDAKQNLKEAQEAYLADWQEFKIEAENKITENEAIIDSFKTKMFNANSKRRAIMKKGMSELEEKNRQLQKRLDEYKDEGKEKWEEFKRQFNNDLDALERSLDDFDVEDMR